MTASPKQAHANGTDGSEAGSKKILRACVVQAGKVIDEQRFRKRAPLSIGSGPGNTFVISDPTLPRNHELFAVRSGRYELVLTEKMKGKVSIAGSEAPVDVAQLKAQGLLKKRGALYYLPLTDQHRGKVVINDLTIIFQFVAPPPPPEKLQLPAAARGSLWQRIDVTFAAAYSIIGISELLFIIFLRFQPAPVPVTIETMDDRWAKLIAPERKPEKKVEQKRIATASTDADKAKEHREAKKEAPPKEEEPKDEAKAKAQAERRAGIRKNIASKGILAVLGTAGVGSAAGAVADVFGEGKVGGDLDSAFQGISGVGVATGGMHTTRGGGSGKAASIGGLATAGGGKVGLGGKAEAKVGTVAAGDAEVDGSLDPGAIGKVIQSRMRMVQDCYERELKRDPSLQGKVEVEFTIGADGRVESARVSSNKMGSDAVGECICSRIRSWRFPKPDGGSVTVNFPFIFAAS